jgi:hypothetical protein
MNSEMDNRNKKGPPSLFSKRALSRVIGATEAQAAGLGESSELREIKKG